MRIFETYFGLLDMKLGKYQIFNALVIKLKLVCIEPIYLCKKYIRDVIRTIKYYIMAHWTRYENIFIKNINITKSEVSN